MSAVRAPAAPDAADLVACVDGLRRYLSSRLYGGDVDEALQQVRVEVWRCAGRYDPSRGRPEAFAFGVARNVVRRRHEAAAHVLEAAFTLEMEDVLPDPRVCDPAELLEIRWETARLMRVLADAVAAGDWAVVVALAEAGGDAYAAAGALGVPVRTVRMVRERVTVTALTVRAALAAADDGTAASADAARSCVPGRGGLRQVLPHLGDDTAAAAARLGLAPGTFRNRRAAAARLVSLAGRILSQRP